MIHFSLVNGDIQMDGLRKLESNSEEGELVYPAKPGKEWDSTPASWINYRCSGCSNKKGCRGFVGNFDKLTNLSVGLVCWFRIFLGAGGFVKHWGT